MAEIMNEELLLTREGYDKIVKEHEELVSVKRAEVAERLVEAIYSDIFLKMQSMILANEHQAEEKIHKKLETMIRGVKIVQEEDVKGDVVNVGFGKVTARNLGYW